MVFDNAPELRLSMGLLWIMSAASIAGGCGDDDATSRNDAIETTSGPDVGDSTITDGADGETTPADVPTDAPDGTTATTDSDTSTTDGTPPTDGTDPTSEVDDDAVTPDVDDTTIQEVVDDVPSCPPRPTSPCEASNTFGTCTGAWVCGVDLVWSCQVPTPAAEVCDGADNDCNGATDEGWRDPVSGVYDRDDACGSCSNDCTVGLGPEEHAHGRCVVGASPTCELVCCTANDPHPSCDGSDYTNPNGQAGDGCEDRVERPCAGEGDCPASERCVDNQCVPNVPGGPCEVDADCAVGDRCFGGICGCAGDTYNAEAVPPNVLIVIDRSSSMTEEIGDTGQSKWEAAIEAVVALTSAYDSQVRFGLKLFPGIDQAGTVGDSCGPGVVWIDPDLDNADDIETFLDDAGTSSGTPIAEALRSLLDYDGLEDAGRNNYVVLVTDGMASCDPPVPEVEALFDEVPQIRTFVIGFGDGVDPDELSAMADAGGTARPGDPSYYQADDPLSLGESLEAIVGNVLGCTYVLGDVPPDTESLDVYFDRVAQPIDPAHATGWDFDPTTNQVTFYGGACDTLRGGTVEDLVFVYGCPNPIIIGDE